MVYGTGVQSLPPLRKVPANILCGQGWLHGVFHGSSSRKLKLAIVNLALALGVSEWDERTTPGA